MERERFWCGTTMIVVPLICLLLPFAPQIEFIQSGTIEGHVSFQGRPLTGGFILFVPEDETCDSAAGYLDEEGHYLIGTRWIRKASTETRFRICLLPAPGPGPGDALRSPDRAGERSGQAAASPELRRLRDPRTSNLKVRLDASPAHVDISL